MSKILQTLLDAKEPMFSTTLRQLERMTGNKGVDVAYIADIAARAHSVMRRIGLDPADTSELELYQALSAHANDTHLFANTDDVGLIFGGDAIVSFNLEDVRENVSQNYSQRTVRHMQCQIQHGLTARYVAVDGDDEVLIDQMIAQSGVRACDLVEYHEHKSSRQKPTAVESVLCIGDIFTDVFIKLYDNEARIDRDKDGSVRLSIPFGTKPPYERADVITSVGPSPNAAVSMARLGVPVSLMSWLGDDQISKESLKYLAHQSVDTTPITIQRNTPSSTYYVLRYGADRTILIKNEKYTYTWRKPARVPGWIYLSLLSGDSWQLHEQLIEYLDDHPEVKFVFQPGTFHFKWGAKKLAKLYRRAEIVIMNREEAVEVTGGDHGVIRQLAEKLHALGPRYVVITDGADGAYAYYDSLLVRVPNYPDPAKPFDRTGAGDAFASTIVAALARGESFETGLMWAPVNSMSVVQKLGAQAGLLKRKEIEAYLGKAPDNYKIEEYIR